MYNKDLIEALLKADAKDMFKVAGVEYFDVEKAEKAKAEKATRTQTGKSKTQASTSKVMGGKFVIGKGQETKTVAKQPPKPQDSKMDQEVFGSQIMAIMDKYKQVANAKPFMSMLGIAKDAKRIWTNGKIAIKIDCPTRTADYLAEDNKDYPIDKIEPLYDKTKGDYAEELCSFTRESYKKLIDKINGATAINFGGVVISVQCLNMLMKLTNKIIIYKRKDENPLAPLYIKADLFDGIITPNRPSDKDADASELLKAA